MLIEYVKPNFEFADDRGKLTQLVREGFTQVNYIECTAGAKRGNHYHKNNIELFYIISGKFLLILETLDGSVSERYEISQGDMFLVKPNLNHSFEFLENTTLISMYDKGVEEDNNTKDIYTL